MFWTIVVLFNSQVSSMAVLRLRLLFTLQSEEVPAACVNSKTRACIVQRDARVSCSVVRSKWFICTCLSENWIKQVYKNCSADSRVIHGGFIHDRISFALVMLPASRYCVGLPWRCVTILMAIDLLQHSVLVKVQYLYLLWVSGRMASVCREPVYMCMDAYVSIANRGRWYMCWRRGWVYERRRRYHCG